MEITANQETGFTDEMRMHIAWDISPNPNLLYHIWYAKPLEYWSQTQFLEGHSSAQF